MYGIFYQINLIFAASLLWHTLSYKLDLNFRKLTRLYTFSWFKPYLNTSHGLSAIAVQSQAVWPNQSCPRV